MDAFVLGMGGLCAGALGGFLGLGGGIVLMPLLRFVMGLSPAHAAGTCVVAVFCTSLSGGSKHVRQGHLQVRSIVPVIVAGIVASSLCSMAFALIAGRGHLLDLGIGLVFSLVSVRMILASRGERVAAITEGRRVDTAVRGSLSLKSAIGAVAGGLPGILGIGTGGVLVPAFTFLLGAPIKTAMAASLTVYSFTAAASSAFKLAQGYVILEIAAPLCLGALAGAPLGAMLNRRFRSCTVQLAFGVLFGFVSLRFIVSSLGASP